MCENTAFTHPKRWEGETRRIFTNYSPKQEFCTRILQFFLFTTTLALICSLIFQFLENLFTWLLSIIRALCLYREGKLTWRQYSCFAVLRPGFTVQEKCLIQCPKERAVAPRKPLHRWQSHSYIGNPIFAGLTLEAIDWGVCVQSFVRTSSSSGT